MVRVQTIMQEQGVLIQPFWRSVFRHANANVRGADAHPIFAHPHYKWWIAACPAVRDDPARAACAARAVRAPFGRHVSPEDGKAQAGDAPQCFLL
jgi:hypothetical protein